MNFRKQSGFTLVEILLVLIIISVMAAMVVPQFAGRGEDARRMAARADIDTNLATALDLYELDMGTYPKTQDGLKALLERPSSSTDADRWNGPYLKKKAIPRDPWSRPYSYAFPGTRNPDGYDLFSLGADGVESKDDITNWAAEENPRP
jgi:general secretion pathway protein G